MKIIEAKQILGLDKGLTTLPLLEETYSKIEHNSEITEAYETYKKYITSLSYQTGEELINKIRKYIEPVGKISDKEIKRILFNQNNLLNRVLLSITNPSKEKSTLNLWVAYDLCYTKIEENTTYILDKIIDTFIEENKSLINSDSLDQSLNTLREKQFTRVLKGEISLTNLVIIMTLELNNIKLTLYTEKLTAIEKQVRAFGLNSKIQSELKEKYLEKYVRDHIDRSADYQKELKASLAIIISTCDNLKIIFDYKGINNEVYEEYKEALLAHPSISSLETFYQKATSNLNIEDLPLIKCPNKYFDEVVETTLKVGDVVKINRAAFRVTTNIERNKKSPNNLARAKKNITASISSLNPKYMPENDKHASYCAIDTIIKLYNPSIEITKKGPIYILTIYHGETKTKILELTSNNPSHLLLSLDKHYHEVPLSEIDQEFYPTSNSKQR